MTAILNAMLLMSNAAYVKCSVEVTLHQTLLLLIKHALC